MALNGDKTFRLPIFLCKPVKQSQAEQHRCTTILFTGRATRATRRCTRVSGNIGMHPRIVSIGGPLYLSIASGHQSEIE